MSKIESIKKLFQAYGANDVPTVLNAMHDDITWLEPGDPAKIPFSGNFKGKQGIIEMFTIEGKNLKLTSFAPKMFFENETSVAVIGSDTADVLSTGKSYATDFVMLFNFDGELISSVQVYMDTLAIATAFEGALASNS